MVQSDLEGELLLYDLLVHKAYCLNETSAIVYKACDGETTLVDLKRSSAFTDDIILLALDSFQRENLLESDQVYETPIPEMTRRSLLRKVGLSSVIALPIISSIIAPPAAHAASCQASGQSCTFSDGQQSNCCSSGDRCTNNGTLACRACLTTGFNTNCSSGAGCCTSQLSSFSNACCNGVSENATGFPGVFSCVCN